MDDSGSLDHSPAGGTLNLAAKEVIGNAEFLATVLAMDEFGHRSSLAPYLSTVYSTD
jgi:hypothetical protein